MSRALAVGARGQDEDKVVVNVPYDSVAGGKILPAGVYSVGRVSPESQQGLIIRNSENPKTSAFVLPVFSDGAGWRSGSEGPTRRELTRCFRGC
jgi:hypothetical protein